MEDLYNENEDCDVCKNGGFPCTCTQEHLKKRKIHEDTEDKKWEKEVEDKNEKDAMEAFCNPGGSKINFEPSVKIEMCLAKDGSKFEGSVMVMKGVRGVTK